MNPSILFAFCVTTIMAVMAWGITTYQAVSMVKIIFNRWKQNEQEPWSRAEIINDAALTVILVTLSVGATVPAALTGYNL